jgi:DNA invertase Pin-like site-specific DNA recombinase
VSRADQNVDLQLDGLRALAAQRGWHIQVEHVDQGVSGAKNRRPALDKLMRAAHRGEIDIVAVWKFDRFARSVQHLVTALNEFRERNIEFVSMQDGIDTSTAAGRMVFGVIASLAEFERELIRERTVAGLAAAKRRGARLGRPRAQLDLGRAKAMRAKGKSLREVSEALSVSLGSLHRALSAA